MNEHFLATVLSLIWLFLAITTLVFISSKKSVKLKRQLFPYLMLCLGVLSVSFLYVASLSLENRDFEFATVALVFILGGFAAFKLTSFCDFCGACLANRYDIWHRTLYCAECGQKLPENNNSLYSTIKARVLGLK